MKTNQVSQHATRPPLTGQTSLRIGLAVFVLFLLPLISVRAGDVYWAYTNSTAVSSNWSLGTSWVGGGVPSGADNAVILTTNGGLAGSFVLVDVSTNVNDFTYTRGPISGTVGSETALLTTILDGRTLSVLGPNGFVIQHSPGWKGNSTDTINGNQLVVSNKSARFVLNSGQTANNSSKSSTINLSGLTNLVVETEFFGAANAFLVPGADGAGDQQVKITLARTNIIKALHADDYTAVDFTNAIEFARNYSNTVNAAFAQNSFYKLGFSNLFLADSIGIGRGYASCAASMNLSSFSTPAMNLNLGFQVLFNNQAMSSSAFFRNTNGTDPVTLLAINVDSGLGAVSANIRQGTVLNLLGGTVDMLVDQVWLSRNSTNASISNVNGKRAGFAFDNGVVNAKKVIAGYMQYTNITFCQGYLVVGSNAVMRVSDTLILGYTPANDPGGDFISAENNSGGQVQINNGSGTNGTLYANKIEVGLASTNNQLVVNGTLVVSNAIASSSKALNVLNVGATGQLKFKATPGVTNAFADSLVNFSGAKIGITEAPTQGETSYVVIKYSGTSPANSFQVGDLPANIKGAVISDDGANIIMTLSTNAPKSLVWRGTENSNWDHASTNWVNTAPPGTNCAFSDSDKVNFDDQSGIPTTINITEAVYPSQVGNGIVMTNSTNAFVFASSGGSIQNASLLKAGTSSLQLDLPTTIGVNVQQGSLTGSGTVSSVSVATNASMNFSGTVNGVLAVSGNVTLAGGGIANNAVNVASGGIFSNSGTVNGPLSMSSSSTVNNNIAGTMSAIGSTTVPTNAVLNNAGKIFSTGTLTVSLGGTLVDTVMGYPDTVVSGSGSINVGQLAVFGTFIPGGNAIKTTKVTDYQYGGGVLGNPNGRVNLNQGSTTILRVDAGAGTNTVILSQNQGFGGSFNFKNFNGGTLVISNVGTPFVAGQSFKFFGYYYDGTETLNAGFNTTNTYPVIQPATPGSGLVWQLNQLIPQGIIKVLSVNDPSLKFTLTNSSFTFNDNGTNKIVNQLTWPEDKTNSWIQTLNTALTNGLTATNWVNLGQSALTNMPPNTYIVTNNITADTATFYRLVWP